MDNLLERKVVMMEILMMAMDVRTIQQLLPDQIGLVMQANLQNAGIVETENENLMKIVTMEIMITSVAKAAAKMMR